MFLFIIPNFNINKKHKNLLIKRSHKIIKDHYKYKFTLEIQ